MAKKEANERLVSRVKPEIKKMLARIADNKGYPTLNAFLATVYKKEIDATDERYKKEYN